MSDALIEIAHVEKVYHRQDAIWPFTVVGRPPQEDTCFGQIIHELTGPLIPTVVHGVPEQMTQRRFQFFEDVAIHLRGFADDLQPFVENDGLLVEGGPHDDARARAGVANRFADGGVLTFPPLGDDDLGADRHRFLGPLRQGPCQFLRQLHPW